MPEASGGQPPSLMDEVRRVIMGRENLDMSQREFLLHREQELQDHVAARIREYEAMMTAIGWLTGLVTPPPPLTTEDLQQQVADAIAELGGSLIERSQREGLDHINPLNAVPTALGAWYYLWGGVADLIPTEGAQRVADNWYDIGEAAMNTDVVSLSANIVADTVNAIVEGLTNYWDTFWQEVDTNGFLIAYGKLRIDTGFLAAELSIDIALGAVTGGAAAGASRVIRVVGRRISRETTEVVIKIGTQAADAVGDAIPEARTVLRLEVRDADIPDNVERLMDEDNLGGAAALDDTASRGTPVGETPATTQVLGEATDRPRPPTSGQALTRAERDYLRSRTPSDEIRNMVNDGQPVASPLNPQPDEWVPGLMREERYAADHIVPASRIMDMDGFADLPQSDQLDILNWPENYHPMSLRANSSRGDKSFEEWTEHIGEGLPVNPELRAQMIPREQRLNEEIQQRIYDLLRRRQEEGVVELPFRSD